MNSIDISLMQFIDRFWFDDYKYEDGKLYFYWNGHRYDKEDFHEGNIIRRIWQEIEENYGEGQHV